MTFQPTMTTDQLRQGNAYWMQGHLLLIAGDEGAYYTRDKAPGRTNIFHFNKVIPITNQHRAMLPTLNKLT